jgi:hypothetical protein
MLQVFIRFRNSIKNDPVTSAYASNLEDLIQEYQPLYWIHGHIHTPSDYEIGLQRLFVILMDILMKNIMAMKRS